MTSNIARTFATMTLAALILAGCAAATPMYDQNGNPAFHIACDGAAVPMSACFKKALEVCPQGYALAGGEQRSLGQIGTAQGSTAYNPYSGSGNLLGFSSPIITKSIVVRCKGE